MSKELSKDEIIEQLSFLQGQELYKNMKAFEALHKAKQAIELLERFYEIMTDDDLDTYDTVDLLDLHVLDKINKQSII